MNNKRLSSNWGNHKGFRSSVPGPRDKDQIYISDSITKSQVSYITTEPLFLQGCPHIHINKKAELSVARKPLGGGTQSGSRADRGLPPSYSLRFPSLNPPLPFPHFTFWPSKFYGLMILGQRNCEGRGFHGKLHKEQEFQLFTFIALAQHRTWPGIGTHHEC